MLIELISMSWVYDVSMLFVVLCIPVNKKQQNVGEIKVMLKRMTQKLDL